MYILQCCLLISTHIKQLNMLRHTQLFAEPCVEEVTFGGTIPGCSLRTSPTVLNASLIVF